MFTALSEYTSEILPTRNITPEVRLLRYIARSMCLVNRIMIELKNLKNSYVINLSPIKFKVIAGPFLALYCMKILHTIGCPFILMSSFFYCFLIKCYHEMPFFMTTFLWRCYFTSKSFLHVPTLNNQSETVWILLQTCILRTRIPFYRSIGPNTPLFLNFYFF